MPVVIPPACLEVRAIVRVFARAPGDPPTGDHAPGGWWRKPQRRRSAALPKRMFGISATIDPAVGTMIAKKMFFPLDR
jgi:hypothetical protein